jgi:hypothetical protein
MARRPVEAAGAARVTGTTVALVLASTALVGTVLAGGVGIAVALSGSASASTWTLWGNIGQTFESVNAVFSGLAFTALVVTFWIQLRELREQRLELQLQRETAKGSKDELHLSALAHLRGIHVQLIKMSIDDPDLADVWPAVEPGLSGVRHRQYLYANLILQQVWQGLTLIGADDDDIREVMRYLFSSPLIREYWQSSAAARAVATRTADELRFTEMADEACALEDDHRPRRDDPVAG